MSEEISEEKVQRLIFNHPWLLDINFENIHELGENGGWERKLDGGLRLDLLCRHKLNGRPVIIEFKKNNFTRENIGQILEYRAGVILELDKDDSEIKQVFGKKLSTPILCLVVKECTDEQRIACNLNGIEVYEYRNHSNSFQDVNINFLKDLRDKYKNEVSVSPTRCDLVDGFYNKLYNNLKDNNLLDEACWVDFKAQNCGERGEYWFAYHHMFINKWLFSENNPSVGIYENIFEKDKPRFVFGLYSTNENHLAKTIAKWKQLYPETTIERKIISIEYENYAEIYLSETDEDKAIEQYIDLIKKYIDVIKKITASC